MTGSEHSLDVYLGKSKIATLTLINDQLYWHYDPIWQQSGYAVSPHLPLHGDIPTLNVQRFLRNLLPEGNGLEELVSNFHISKYNIKQYYEVVHERCTYLLSQADDILSIEL